MKPLPLLSWLAVAAGLAFLTGCGSGKPKLAFVTNNPANFWDIVEAGARKAEAEEQEFEVVFRRPTKGEAAVQKDLIDKIISQSPKAISVSVIDPDNQTTSLDEIAAKAPLLTVDTDAPASKRLCFVGADNYEAGKAAGAMVKQAMPDGGTFALFIGNMSQQNSRNRVQGVLDELAGQKDSPLPPAGEEVNKMYGKYKLYQLYLDLPVGEAQAKINAERCLDKIGKEPNVCLVGLFAYNPPKILAAVKDKVPDRLGQIKIVGFDEETATLDGIRDGHIVGTVSQQPWLYGYHAVKLMAAIARGQNDKLPKDGRLATEHLAVTKDGRAVTSSLGGDKPHKGKSVEDFRKELDAMTKK